jgi:hypothetical protein
MKLISNVGQAHRMYVVQVLALIAAVQGIWAAMPPEIVAKLPEHLLNQITAGLAVAGVIARVIKQFAPEFEDTQPMKDDER